MSIALAVLAVFGAIMMWLGSSPRVVPLHSISVCIVCGRRFIGQQGLVWHAQATHLREHDMPMTDDSPVRR